MTYQQIVCTVALSVIAVPAALAQSQSSERDLRKAYKQPAPYRISPALDNMDKALDLEKKKNELYWYKRQLNLTSRAELVRLKAELAVAELEAAQRQQQAALENQQVKEAARQKMVARLANEAVANRVEVDICQELMWTKALLRTRPELREALQDALGHDPREVRHLADILYEEVRATCRDLDFSHTADAKRYLDAIVRAAEQARRGRNFALVQNDR